MAANDAIPARALTVLLQKGKTWQIRFGEPFGKSRGAYREKGFGEEQPVLWLHGLRLQPQHRDVDALGSHVRAQRVLRTHMPLDARMLSGEGRQPCRQPERGEGAIGRNHEAPPGLVRLCADRIASHGQPPQRLLDRPQQFLAGGRRARAAAPGPVAGAGQQGRAELLFKRTDLMADGAGADMQPFGRPRETAFRATAAKARNAGKDGRWLLIAVQSS